MDIEALYQLFSRFPSVQTDSRKIKSGDIFFALKGPTFNGNEYALQALADGAAFSLCDEPVGSKDDRIIYTDDVLQTLQELAKFHRMQFDIPIIAITGSNGKTTTKELAHAVLSSSFHCHTTKGNLNNHIGIPLTLLAMNKSAKMAVIEMGANHLHEIESYCNFTEPTHGLITNCGKAHLEGFGSEDGVRKGKGELFDYLSGNNGTAFINSDLFYLREMSASINHKISYGSANADYCGNVISHSDYLEVNITSGTKAMAIRTQLAGDYNFANVMSAVCIGKTFGVTDEKIKAAIENYAPSNSRSQLIKRGSNTIVLDAYNANPSSMRAAIENFASMAGASKTIILGGMKEMGAASVAEHAAVIELLGKYRWHNAVVAGAEYENVPRDILHFKTTAEAATWFQNRAFENELILIKGSRGMAMEKLLGE